VLVTAPAGQPVTTVAVTSVRAASAMPAAAGQQLAQTGMTTGNAVFFALLMLLVGLGLVLSARRAARRVA